MEELMTKEELFDLIYRTYQHEVYKIALYYVKDDFTAQDVAQKAFYNFYLHMEDVDEDKARSYLLRTARNLSYNWTRDSKWELQGEYLENVSEDDISFLGPESEYIRQEYQQEVKDFLNEIMDTIYEENESWYHILNLVYGQEKKQEDVARELGLSLEVLHSKIYRAKKWIKKRYRDRYQQLKGKF